MTLFAGYHQIHAFDEDSEADLGDAWTDQATVDRLAVSADAVAIGTAVNVDVAVSVEVLDGPVSKEAAFDHVMEASIRCSSGRLVVMGCTDFEHDARRFLVTASGLCLCGSRSNLDRAFRAGIDAAGDPLTMNTCGCRCGRPLRH